MGTSPTAPGGSTPTIPLSPAVRKAYEDLYDKAELAVQSTTDPVILASLNDSKDAIGAVLSADNQYRLDQNTANFNTLLKQINAANDALTKLKKDVAGVAGKIAVFGDVVGGITKVLSLLGVG